MCTAIATLFGSGLSPLAPGTAGSAVAAVAYLVFCDSLTPASWTAVLIIVFAISVPTAHAEARARGNSDPGPVVIDEGIGFLVSVAYLPYGVWTAAAGFLLFRLLDIIKPPPARQLEHLTGGWGIVLDDIAAGVWTNLLLRVGFWLAWQQATPEG